MGVFSREGITKYASASGGAEGADAPSPYAGVFGKVKKGRGLVLGKTKSEVDAAVTRVVVVAVRRTHPPRNAAP